MAKLNDRQQRLLNSVKETYDQLRPSLTKLEEDFLLADFKAKAPVRQAIEAAEEAGVPTKRISEDGMGFSYPAKMKQWIQPPPSVVRMLMDNSVTAVAQREFEDTVQNVATVDRDPGTGTFNVFYQGAQYQVPSFGPASECWSSADPAIPQGVYDMIQAEHPSWVLLEDED